MTYHDHVARNVSSHGSSETATRIGTAYVSAFMRPNVTAKLRTMPGLNASEERAES
jgi:hypothetical protein